MDASVLILSGSARADGNTALVVSRLADRLGGRAHVVDASMLAIGPFRYDATFDRDDFARIVSAMLAHQHIVFATPVYWYAMSGVIKTVFDRLSDLLGRPEGRALAGRQMWLAASGTDPALPDGFDVPFARTAEWFGMDWRGATYVIVTGRDLPGEAALAPLDDLLRALGD